MSRRITMMAALLGMGLAVPDSAAAPATPDPPAVEASPSPADGTPTQVNRLPGDPQELMRAPFTVESLDRSDRLVIVRSPDGSRTTIRAVPAATEFDALQAGQPVLLDYYPSSLVSFSSAGSVAAETAAAPTRANAPILGAAGANQITAKAHVTAVDSKTGMLEVTTAGGNPHTLDVGDPAARTHLRSLRNGDRVTVTYTEAVAVGVHPEAGD